jgi:hypothetical protein
MTLSLTVQARTKRNGHNDLFFKPGTTIVLA